MTKPSLEPIGCIAGGQVFSPEGFEVRDLPMKNGRIAAEPISGDAGMTLHAEGCWVIPGLIDVHTHGCMGHDLCDADSAGLAAMGAYEASRGITAFCPTTMTFAEDRLTRVMAVVADFAGGPAEAEVVGINMEGPYISPAKVGAQNPAFVRPCDVAEFARLQEAAGGRIKIVDIAPETPGALQAIAALAPAVRVSVAHTCADYACAAAAFDAGASQVTHLFNAMPGLHHREPGPIAAAAERPWVTPELICDGVHVHPAMVRLAFALFGADRVIMISDSMRACGLVDGTYDLGGQEVQVRGSRATLVDGTLAGSVTDLMGCLKTAATQMDIPLADAVRAASTNPARALGLEGQRGTLDPGAVADAVVLDGDLNVVHVVLRGRLLL